MPSYELCGFWKRKSRTNFFMPQDFPPGTKGTERNHSGVSNQPAASPWPFIAEAKKRDPDQDPAISQIILHLAPICT